MAVALDDGRTHPMCRQMRDESLDEGRLARARGGCGDGEYGALTPLVRDAPTGKAIGGGGVHVEEESCIHRKRQFVHREVTQNDAELAVAARDGSGKGLPRIAPIERGERLPVARERRQYDLRLTACLGQECPHEIKVVEGHVAREDKRPLRLRRREPRRNRCRRPLLGAFVRDEMRPIRRRELRELSALPLCREHNRAKACRTAAPQGTGEQRLAVRHGEEPLVLAHARTHAARCDDERQVGGRHRAHSPASPRRISMPCCS